MAVVRRGAARPGRVVLLAVMPLVLLAVLTQALLPGLAATRVRERVARYGSVKSVRVSAFPALELLWGQADSVTVAAGTLAATPQQIASLLWEARDLGTLTVVANDGVLHAQQLPGALAVGQVRLQKLGSALSMSATLTQAQLDAALPSGFAVEPVASGGGAVTVRASGGLFGLQASLTASVRAVGGDLIAEPRGVPFGGLARVTLFSDAHLKVDGLGLRVVDRSPLRYRVTVRASLV